MDAPDDLASGEPPVIDPYEVLGLERAATADQVKSAYRKKALQCHPDKVSADAKAAAHAQFQEVAFAYAVLSDAARRKRYDETGSTAESVVDADGFSWSDFYRAAFADAVSASAIEAFAETYKSSDEERADLLQAYTRSKGRMDAVYESVMLSSVLDDDARFRAIIDAAIAAGDVPSFAAYASETKQARQARAAEAQRESREAEEYAKELGVHDKLFGDKDGKGKARGKKGKGKDKDDGQAGLAALIQKRQQDRAATFLDGLAEKYGATEPKKGRGGNKKGKKRRATDEDEDEGEDGGEVEPSEAAFQATQAQLKARQAARQAKRAKKARK